MFTEKIDNLLRQVSLIDILRDTQKVVHRGGSKYLVQCPFHSGGSENNPSMSVDDDKGLYKCFTCNEAGNIIKYLRTKMGLSFKDSISYLGKRFSIDVSDFFSTSGTKKDFIYKESKRINKIASNFYGKNLLLKDDGVYKNLNAVNYLKNRKIPFEIIKSFKIGYAPKYWDALTNALRKQGVHSNSLLALGIGKTKNGNSIYDAFINRIMFPIIDENDDIIGFGGRSIDNMEPKYLNSKESLIFKKKYTLYGINLARNAIMKHDSVIIVEGYMDVIALHKMGINNAVGTLGTACTEFHIKKLTKYTKNIVFAFDNDDAGIRATEAAIRIALKEGINPTVLVSYGVKDFDEYFTNYNIDDFNILYDKKPIWYDYLIDNMQKQSDDSIEYKLSFFQNMFTYLTLVGSSLVVDDIIAHVAKRLHVDKNSLIRDYENYKNGFSSHKNIRVHNDTQGKGKKSNDYAEERELIYLLIVNPKLISEYENIISIDDFNGVRAKDIYIKLLMLNRAEITTDDICLGLDNISISDKVNSIRNTPMYTEYVKDKVSIAIDKMRARSIKIRKDSSDVRLKIDSLLQGNGSIDELFGAVKEMRGLNGSDI